MIRVVRALPVAGALWAPALGGTPAVAAAAPTPPDTIQLAVRLGPAFEAHSDLLASPFSQHGGGVDGALSFVRGGLSVEFGAGTSSTSAGERLDEGTGGVEDVWAGGLDLRYVRAAGRVLGADLDLGVGVSGITSVRRHHYLGGSNELFADLLVPLSAVARAARALSPRTALGESLDLAVVTLLFRSPFSGAKEFPAGSLSAPWETTVVRHRLALEHTVGGRMRLGVSHGLGLIASTRNRKLRLVRQDVSASLTILLGGGP